MAVRNIIKIEASKCNGCAQCVNACAEGALALVNGVATLVKDSYCDGLGACIGECPTGALTIVRQEAAAFDETAVAKHLAQTKTPAFVCPSAREKNWEPVKQAVPGPAVKSRLTHWPVKLELISPQAPVLQGADLLICADCVPFAYGNFHNDFLQGKPVVIGCPKLNDTDAYLDKLTSIFKNCNLRSVTVIHMEVPCCFGLVKLLQQAVVNAKATFPIEEKIISIQG